VFISLVGYLSAFTTDASGQLNVLGHDGDTFSMNSAQVGVFEETDQIRLEKRREMISLECSSEKEDNVLHTILAEP
jgi:hypothetical protein